MIIRDATQKDGAKVRKIAFAIFPEYGMTPDPDRIDFDLAHFGEGYTNVIAELVAESDSEVIGSVMLTKKNKFCGKLSGFYVNPDYQGKGTGRVLLKELITRARKAGLKEIYLETWENMVQAVHLYESLGWIRQEDPSLESGANRSYLLKLK